MQVSSIKHNSEIVTYQINYVLDSALELIQKLVFVRSKLAVISEWAACVRDTRLGSANLGRVKRGRFTA